MNLNIGFSSYNKEHTMKSIFFYLSVAVYVVATNFVQAAHVTPEYQPEPPPRDWPDLNNSTTLPKEAASHETIITDIDEAGLLAKPVLLNLLLDKSVLHNDMEGIRVLLPVYRKLPIEERDSVLQQLAESKLAMNEGNFGQAAHILRSLIADKPDSDVIRLYLAIALFYDKQDAAAQSQFNKLMAQTALPEREKQLIAAFNEQLRHRYRWQFDGGLNYSYEPNINNAPTIKQQGNLHTDTESESVSGITYRLNAEKDWPLADNWLAKFSADLYGKYYPSAKNYNDLLLSGAIGIGYRDARWDIALMPYATHRRFGEDTLPYSDALGVKLDIQTQISPKWRLLNTVSGEKIHYEKRFRFNGNRLRMGQTVIYQARPQQAWFGGIEFERENLHDKDNSNRQWTASLGWIQEWPKGLSSRTGIAWSQQKYRAPMPWPILETRRDQTLRFQLSLWHRNIHFWGITPRLTAQHIRNQSNVFFYGYKKNNLFLEFSKTF